jgi:Thioredoxin
LLLFFTTSRSGPARRMESLLAHLARKERARLRVSLVDADESPELAAKLNITEIPTLVLIKDRRPVARLEGRASEPQIQRIPVAGRKRDRADLNCTILHGRTGDRPGQLLFGFSLVRPFAHPLAREFGSLM